MYNKGYHFTGVSRWPTLSTCYRRIRHRTRAPEQGARGAIAPNISDEGAEQYKNIKHINI